MKKFFNVKTIALCGVLAGLNIILTLFFQPIAYGPLQFRLGEITGCFGIYGIPYILASILSGILINLFSPFNLLWEVVIDTPIFLIAQVVLYIILRKLSTKIDKNKLALLYLLGVTILVGIVVGNMLHFTIGLPFGITFLELILSEALTLFPGYFLIVRPVAKVLKLEMFKWEKKVWGRDLLFTFLTLPRWLKNYTTIII